MNVKDVQDVTSAGQRKRVLNPRQDSNLFPPEHRVGVLSTELRRGTLEEQGHTLSSYLTRVLRTARISNVDCEIMTLFQTKLGHFPYCLLISDLASERCTRFG